ncbi:cullin family protein [Besnoitia besnoiti]|uniref:Cullin family protein n=1 Tax=Besnoitia besnoiti TaxID=94643 RepID=A0A2A9M741_BESBE|nr:cullin family protein [Besnoitia besnoiti]PFH32121.1 cullin family protein [Besnoitia besnoiti]
MTTRVSSFSSSSSSSSSSPAAEESLAPSMGIARAMGGPQGIVELEAGWTMLRDCAIRRLEHFLQTGEALGRRKDGKLCIFTRKEYSDMYTTVYNMCTQRYPNNWSAQLYERYGEALASYVNREVVPRLEGLTEEELLRELLLRWKNHKIYVSWLERFFVYLDRYYVKLQSEEPLHHKGILIFKELVFNRVRVPLREAILRAIQRQREGMRTDEELLGEIVYIYIGLEANGLSLYQRELEDYLLPESADYYTRLSATWIQNMSFTEYMYRAQEALLAEQRRCGTVLHRSTKLKLQAVVFDALLSARQSLLLEKETAIAYLLAHDKRDELRQAHRLFSYVEGGVEAIALTFKKFVSDQGNKIVDQRLLQLEATASASTSVAEAQQADAAFVQILLDLHEKFKRILEECFLLSSPASSSRSLLCGSNTQQRLFRPYEDPSWMAAGPGRTETDVVSLGTPDPLFQKSLKEAFEHFVNRDMGRQNFAQLLSFFCDRLLKKTGEKRTEDQIERMLVRVVEMFNYVTEKDVFAECYRSQLARRLLHETSASEDLEKSVISKLKLKCGAHFTSKLEGMLHDLGAAADTYRKFIAWVLEQSAAAAASAASSPSTAGAQGAEKTEARARAVLQNVSVLGAAAPPRQAGTPGAAFALVDGVEFSAQVLTTGYWPTYPTTTVKLPPVMKHCQALFEEFYASQTQHRRVTWIPSLGTVVVSAQFQKRHDLICNTYQACVLLLFNADSPYRPGAVAASSSPSVEASGVEGHAEAREDPKLTVAMMTEALALDETMLKKMLASFFLGRFKIIRKLSQDEYQVNAGFTCLNRKIKIPTPIQEEVQSRERVEEDRSIAIEAAIVRIMKARKVLQHQQLLAEVLSQLSFFKPNPKLIKKRLEHLIEREFLERDRENSNLYRYVA